MKNSILVSLIALGFYVLFPGYAQAGMAGIGNSTVNEGQLSTQLRLSLSEDNDSQALDGRFRSRLMVDYGFTDDFAFGVYLQGENFGNDSQELDSTIADARFEFTEAKTHGYYSGMRLRYTYKDGDKKPDNAHIRFILGVPIDKWDLRLNQIFAHEVGEDSRHGIGIDTRLQATYFYHPDHRMGLETLSDFGYGRRLTSFDEQNHVLGPVFAGKIDGDTSYEFGYRHGISKAAPDHNFRIFLTKNF